MPARNYIELIEKTFRVLEAIADSDNGLTLSALSAQSELVKSSTFRILYTLAELGYVQKRDWKGTYTVTSKLIRLARSPSHHPSLVKIAHGRLAELSRKLDESAWLAEWRNGSVIMIDVAEASHPLHLYLNVGDRCPVHASALGKAIAAHLPPRELMTILGKARLVRFTDRTLTSRQALRAQLARVRHEGYALNDEETILGAVALAAPIFDSLGKAFAAVSVTAPTARCNEAKRAMIIAAVKRTGDAISQDLMSLRYEAHYHPVQV
jgi:IclR family acetate operon transcriptional repressor